MMTPRHLASSVSVPGNDPGNDPGNGQGNVRFAARMAILATWVAALLLPALTPGCGTSSEPLLGRRSEVLAALGTNVLLPTYRTLQERAVSLDGAVAAYASSGSDTDRDAARAAFTSFMEILMQAEMMEVGPLGAANITPGGQDLFDEMYSWAVIPLSPCGIDRILAGDSYNDGSALSAQTLNVRGMGAVEYLLFVEGTDNACDEFATINTDGTWTALAADPAALTLRRATMAQTLVGLVRGRADALVSAWDPAFLQELTDPTRSGAIYRSAQEGLNAIADGLFVLDQVTKDMRIAPPAGIVNCTTATCPELLESLFAHQSKERILNNLIGLRSVYTGGEGLGFDDLLRDVMAVEFELDMRAHIDEAIVAVGEIDGTLEEALVSDLADVLEAHAAIQVVVMDLKTTFLGALSLDPPNRAGADND